MAQVISFDFAARRHTGSERSALARDHRRSDASTIVIFTGVRYERIPDCVVPTTNATVSRKKAHVPVERRQRNSA
jgi:hypothetical protein